jgi:hypothetical protein
VIAVPFELSAQVLDLPGNEPLDLSRWDGTGVPAALVLSWVEDTPITPSTVAALESVDVSELGVRDLPRLLKAWDRAEAHAGAQKAKVVERIAAAHKAFKGWSDLDPAPNEVGIALRLPLAAAQAEVHRAGRLRTHLPATLAAYDDGQITRDHVRKIVTATDGLAKAKCAAVEELVLPGAEDLSVRQFARKVRRAVAKLHPREFGERHRAAASRADVTLATDEDGMGWISATMPNVDATIVKTAVDAYAMRRKLAGDARPLGVLRTEGLRTMCERYLTGEITGRVPTAHGRPITINICATPGALLGLTDTPGDIPGIGPVPIEVVRAMASEAQLRWMTISETNGALLDYVPTVQRIGTRLHEFIDALYVTSVGPHSTVPASSTDGEHLVPFGQAGGVTEPNNLAAMDRPWHRAKTHAGFIPTRQRDGSIRWTTPLGQAAVVQPYDYRLGP